MAERRSGRHERKTYPELGQMLGQMALFELSQWEQIQVTIIEAQIETEALPEWERDALTNAFQRTDEEARWILAQ